MGGVTAALLAFGVAALMMVLLMFTLALVIGAAQQRTVEAMRAGAPTVKRWGRRILMLVGAWFIALACLPTSSWTSFLCRAASKAGWAYSLSRKKA